MRKGKARKEKKDISYEIELKNGKANPFGWSQSEVWHEGKRIGFLYCGEFTDFGPGYSTEIKKVDEKTVRGIIYKEISVVEDRK
jgi:hypothetical protein